MKIKKILSTILLISAAMTLVQCERTISPRPEPIFDGPDDQPYWIQISAGSTHTCGLWDPDNLGRGRVYCWGNNQWGQSDAPDNDDFIAVAAGNFRTCGIRDTDGNGSGFIECWGGRPHSETDCFEQYGSQDCPDTRTNREFLNPPRHDNFVQIDGGWDFCAIRQVNPPSTEGTVSCWGLAGLHGVEVDYRNRIYSQVSVSDNYLACGILADSGHPQCWGTGIGIQDNINPPDFLNPAVVPARYRNLPFKSISVGRYQVCGLSRDGEENPHCWGYNFAAGLREEIEHSSAIGVGLFMNCYIDLENENSALGAIRCYGNDGDEPDRFALPIVQDSMDLLNEGNEASIDDTRNRIWRGLSVSKGGFHACALHATNGANDPRGFYECWGSNVNGKRRHDRR
jgi:hypothetical protein